MNESQKHYAKCRKKDTNCYIQFDSIQNYRDRNQIRLPGAGQGEINYKSTKGKRKVKKRNTTS